MDRITKALLDEFSKEFDLEKESEDRRFEHFAAYLATKRHFSENTFDPALLVTGSGGDIGIDSIATIVNNNLVFEPAEVHELLEVNGFLDVTFVFAQSSTSSSFDSGKIAKFGFGVRDFFTEGKLPRNAEVEKAAKTMAAIFDKSSKFRDGKNPSCFLYYVTTGNWQNDQSLVVRADAEVGDIKKGAYILN